MRVDGTAPAREPGPDTILVQAPRLAALLDVDRQRVLDHVRRRRAEGASIERVIPELRCLVREAQSCEACCDPTDLLMAVVIGWAVESYLDPWEPRRGVHGS